MREALTSLVWAVVEYIDAQTTMARGTLNYEVGRAVERSEEDSE